MIFTHNNLKAAKVLRLFTLVMVVSVVSGVKAQSHLVRLGDDSAGNAKRVAVSPLGDERFVAAVEDKAGNLKVIVWDVDAEGKFNRRDSAEAGQTSIYAIASRSDKAFVTAVQKENGNLRLIDWSVTSSGTIHREGQTDAGRISRVAIVAAGRSRVITATQNSDNETKLIVWDRKSDGTYTRKGEADVGNGKRVGVAALSATQIVSVVRTMSDSLKVSVWKVNPVGTLVAQDSATALEEVKEITITNTASDRVVTAVTLSSGFILVQAWQIGAMSGSVSLSSTSNTTGTGEEVSLAAVGSTKVVTALKQHDQTLKLITWRVVDNVERLADISDIVVGRTSVTTLGWDRIITAVQDSKKDNDLKVIDWGDSSMVMLHLSNVVPGLSSAPSDSIRSVPPGSRPIDQANTSRDIRKSTSTRIADLKRTEMSPLMTKVPVRPGDINKIEGELVRSPGPPPPPPPGPPAPKSPSPAATFLPQAQGFDPMIAVGKDYVVVTQDHRVEFLYKKDSGSHKIGDTLASKNGEFTYMSADTLFSGFQSANTSSGAVNLNNINRHLRFAPSTDANLSCPDPGSGSDPCMNDFYDTRVAYDPYQHHFIVLSGVRGVQMGEGVDAVVRRYLAIAVSKTEDPRDGWNQWVTTESNYSDWPRMAVADGILVLAHNACKNPDSSDPCGNGDHDDEPGNTMALRPMLYVINMNDLSANKTVPRNWKVYSYETDGGTLYPVIHHGDSDGWTYAARAASGNTTHVYRFKQKSWDDIPTLHKASMEVDGEIPGFREGIYFRQNRIYCSAGVRKSDREPNVKPERWNLRVLRFPISETSSNFKMGPCPSDDKCLDMEFGLRASDDDENDEWSYEMPSLAVNKDGDMIVVYGRVPLDIKGSRGQEARYQVIYDDSRGKRGSVSLHRGTAVLKDFYCSGGVKENSKTPEPYWHLWRDQYKSNGDLACAGQSHYQDYGTATIDPEGNFWIVHAYADGDYKMIGGKVVP